MGGKEASFLGCGGGGGCGDGGGGGGGGGVLGAPRLLLGRGGAQ